MHEILCVAAELSLLQPGRRQIWGVCEELQNGAASEHNVRQKPGGLFRLSPVISGPGEKSCWKEMRKSRTKSLCNNETEKQTWPHLEHSLEEHHFRQQNKVWKLQTGSKEALRGQVDRLRGWGHPQRVLQKYWTCDTNIHQTRGTIWLPVRAEGNIMERVWRKSTSHHSSNSSSHSGSYHDNPDKTTLKIFSSCISADATAPGHRCHGDGLLLPLLYENEVSVMCCLCLAEYVLRTSKKVSDRKRPPVPFPYLSVCN